MCEVGNQQTDEGSRDDELFWRTGDLTKLELIDLTEMFGNVLEKLETKYLASSKRVRVKKKAYQFYFKLSKTF